MIVLDNGKDIEKTETTYIAGKNVKWYNHSENSLAVP